MVSIPFRPRSGTGLGTDADTGEEPLEGPKAGADFTNQPSALLMGAGQTVPYGTKIRFFVDYDLKSASVTLRKRTPPHSGHALDDQDLKVAWHIKIKLHRACDRPVTIGKST